MEAAEALTDPEARARALSRLLPKLHAAEVRAAVANSDELAEMVADQREEQARGNVQRPEDFTEPLDDYRAHEETGFEQEPAQFDPNERNLMDELERGPDPTTDPTWEAPERWGKPSADKGTWERGGTPGDSRWTPHDPGAFGIDPGDSIPFREGVPDLAEYARRLPSGESGTIDVEGLIGDARRDFWLADGRAGEQCGMTSREFRQWRADNRLTWHHYGGGELQLVPQRLHGALHHVGSASEIRARRR